MILWPLLLFVLAAFIEAMVINYRTRQSLADMDHTWVSMYRIFLFVGLGFVYYDGITSRLLPLIVAFWMQFSLTHKLLLTPFRWLGYPKLSYFRMGNGFWDRRFMWLFPSERSAWLAQALAFAGLYVATMFYIVPLS